MKLFAKAELAKSNDKRIQDVISKLGISMPSKHLGFFQSKLLPAGDVNGNGVRVTKEACLEALPTLVQSQVNFEHMGAGFVCGAILDAFWNEESESIDIVFSFYKDLYPEDYKTAIEKANDGILANSFELVHNTKTSETDEKGVKTLNEVIFTGVGLLLENPPAYDDARIYDYAKKILSRLESQPELVFASKIKETCEKILSDSQDKHTTAKIADENKEVSEKIEMENSDIEKGGSTMNEEQKELIETLKAELGEFAKDFTDEDFLNESKVEEARAEQAKFNVKTTVNKEEETSVEDNGDTTVTETVNVTETVTDSDGTETTYTVDSETVRTYTQAELDEVKASYETQIVELKAQIETKDAEVKTVKERAEKVATLKAELKDNSYCKDFTDEDYLDEGKVENARLKKENDDLKAKLSEKPTEEVVEEAKVEETEEASLETGHTENEEKVESVLDKRFRQLRKK